MTGVLAGCGPMAKRKEDSMVFRLADPLFRRPEQRDVETLYRHGSSVRFGGASLSTRSHTVWDKSLGEAYAALALDYAFDQLNLNRC